MADPVADFLAREHDILAEIDGAPADPVAASDVPANVEITNEFGDLAVSDPVIPQAEDDFSAFSAPAPVAEPSMNGHSQPLTNGGSNSSGPSPVPAFPRIEAENIRRWREEQKVVLEKKDEAEEKRKQEWKTSAAKELSDWYKQREATLKGTKDSNRKAEEEHLAAFGREQGENAQWDEIAKLCEAKAQKGGKDVSRLKSLLLHLKEQNSK